VVDEDFGGTFPFLARHARVGDVALAYVDEGPRDSAPVLLLHGNPTWSYMYRVPIAQLAAAGHRCVAPDHMGFGRSDKPAQLGRYHLAAHVENLVGLVDQLDLRDILLVVHDWGGPIGFGALLERPDRFRAAVVMNSWAWELPSFLPPFLREFRTDGLGEILALGGNLMVESIPGGMATREVDGQMMAAYRAPFPDYWSRLGPLAFQRDIPLTARDRSAEAMGRIHTALDELDLPLALVWGMRDPVFQSVFLDQWQELFPGASLTKLEDAGHFLVEDRPDEVTQAIAAFA
jgi:cis-3-alkyl-4-acyloxetan-2-one decarboxylase